MIRKIASDWHGGQWSALYALASSGHYDIGTLAEIRRTYNATSQSHRMRRSHRQLRWLYREILSRLKASRPITIPSELREGERLNPFIDTDGLWS
jgi:hypothetical protein